LVLGGAVGRGGPHPRGRVLVLAFAPVLPRKPLRFAVVVDDELGLRVDRVLAVGERELEQLRLGGRLRRARLDAEVAVDAAQVVDLVDEPVALAGAHGVVGRVVLSTDVDAPRGAYARAELTPDALLHAVLVAVEDVAAMEPDRLHALVLRVLDGDDPTAVGALEQLAERDREPIEVAHQTSAPSIGAPAASSSRRCSAVRLAAASSAPATASTTAPTNATTRTWPNA